MYEEDAMTQRCQCCASLQTTETVEAVARRSARVREVLATLGLDQCCGAHLTLAEAAAAAGVPLETLLARLDAALAAGASS
jgi:iron-sulfur cluster repair protein YtfE (RIC family)